ncbi:hypothetical protein NP493_305g03027 [Ridgeia piscesae]|uniref:Uncharacterized protein n=1 Tax=Ridgeia piscesae TaxID=27915 RepID=A0AAD9L7J7_RIDPI|nr:hypothetical protein NP493_305g03027 [Ridgeia piscesae]
MVGFRMAGFMLSGSGIRVFVLGNMGLGWRGTGKVQDIDGAGWGVVGSRRDGVWRGRTRVVVCIAYWRCLKSAIVRLMSCNAPLKVSRLLWANTLDGSLFHWTIVRGKKLYL